MGKRIKGWLVAESEGHKLAVEKKEDVGRYRELQKLRDEIREKTRLRPKVTFYGIRGLLYTAYLEMKVDSVAGLHGKSIWELARMWNRCSITVSKQGRYITGTNFRHNGYEVQVDPEDMSLSVMPEKALMLFEVR